jgi:phosphatidylglycerophosphatase B
LIKPLLIISLVNYLVFLVVVWVSFREFDPCLGECGFAYWTTQSGGRTGTFLILLLTCIIHTIAYDTLLGKLLGFLRSFSVLSLILILCAAINEYGIKRSLKIVRPSHSFMIRHARPAPAIDSLYGLSTTARKEYFRRIIAADSINLGKMDPRVLHHWIEESGYSFPSGHTFNAFLIASVLSFTLLQYASRKLRWLCVVPVIWAFLVGLSRLLLGAHSPWDVSIGAAMGLLIAHGLLAIRPIRHLIVPELKR